jgi:hypothetical protein
MPVEIGSINPQTDFEASRSRFGILAASNSVFPRTGNPPTPSMTTITNLDPVWTTRERRISSGIISLSNLLLWNNFEIRSTKLLPAQSSRFKGKA